MIDNIKPGLSADEFIGEWLINNTGIKGPANEAYFSLHMLFDSRPAKNYLSKMMDDYCEYKKKNQ